MWPKPTAGRYSTPPHDSLMAGFGVSDPNVDGMREALAAGCAMLARFDALSDRWRRDLDIDAGVFTGVHLGEVALPSLRAPGTPDIHLAWEIPPTWRPGCAVGRAPERFCSPAPWRRPWTRVHRSARSPIPDSGWRSCNCRATNYVAVVHRSTSGAYRPASGMACAPKRSTDADSGVLTRFRLRI